MARARMVDYRAMGGNQLCGPIGKGIVALRTLRKKMQGMGVQQKDCHSQDKEWREGVNRKLHVAAISKKVLVGL